MANKQDLQKLDIDTQGMSDGTKSIVQQMKAMAGIDIMQGTNYKSTYQILDELHDKWSDLSDAEQAAISEAIGGKRGGNVLASLMSNWKDAQDALQSSINSQGSAQKEQAHYEQSVQYRIDQFKASLQQLSYDFLNSNLLNQTISGANELLQIVDAIVSKIGSIPSIIATLAGMDIIRGLLTGQGGIASIIKSFVSTKYGDQYTSQNSMQRNIKTLITQNGAKSSTYAATSAEKAALDADTASNNANAESEYNLAAAKQNTADASVSAASAQQAQTAAQNTDTAANAENAASEQALKASKQDIATIGTNGVDAQGNPNVPTLFVDEQAASKKQAARIQKAAEEQAAQYHDNFQKSLEEAAQNSPIFVDTEKTQQEKYYDKLASSSPIFVDNELKQSKKLADAQKAIEENWNSFKGYNLDEVIENISEDAQNAADSFSIFKDVGGSYFDPIVQGADQAAGAVSQLGEAASSGGSILSNIGSAIGNFVSSNIVAIILTAIPIVIGLVQKIKNAGKDAQQAMNNSVQNYQGTKSEIDSISDSIQQNADSIAAIKAQGPITITDKEDINNLKEQNAQLQQQLQTKQAIADVQAIDTLKDTRKAYKKNFTKNDKTGVTQQDIDSRKNKRADYQASVGGYVPGYGSKDKDIATHIANYQYDKQTLSGLKRLYEGSSGKRTEEITDQVNQVKDNIASQTEKLSTAYSNIEEQISTYDSVDQSLWTTEDHSNYQNLIQNRDMLLKALHPEEFEQTKLDQAVSSFEKLSGFDFGNFADANDYLVDFLKNSKKSEMTVDDLKDKIPDLYKAISDAADDAGEDSNVWLQDYVNSINKAAQSGVQAAQQQTASFTTFLTNAQNALTQFSNANAALNDAFSGSGLTAAIEQDDSGVQKLSGDIGAIIDAYSSVKGYSFDSLFTRTANGIQINTQALEKLQKEQSRVVNNNFTKQLSDLNKQLRSAAMQNKDTSGIEAQIEQVKALQAAYEGQTSAYNQWLSSHGQTQAGNVYDTIQGTALKQGDDLLEQGLVGTTEFRKLAELFSGQDLSSATTDEIVKAYGVVNQTIDGTTYKLRDFYEEGTKGSDNFANALVQIGQASKDANGNINFDSLNIDDLARKFHTSSDVILSQINKLNDRGAQIKIFNDEDIAKLKQINNEFGATQQKIKNKDNGTGVYTSAINFDINDLNDADSIQSKIKQLQALKIKPGVDDTGVQLINDELDELKKKLDIINGTTIEPGFNSTTVTQAERTKKQLSKTLQIDEKYSVDKFTDPQTLQYAQALANASEQTREAVGIKSDDAQSIIKELSLGSESMQRAADALATQAQNNKTGNGGGTLQEQQFRTGTSKPVKTTVPGVGTMTDSERSFVTGTDKSWKQETVAKPQVKEVKVDADTSSAQKKINDLNKKGVSNKQTHITADASQADKIIDNVNKTKTKDKNVNINGHDNTGSATKSAKQNVDSIPNKKNVTVGVQDNASPTVNALISKLTSLHDKTVTITTAHNETYTVHYNTNHYAWKSGLIGTTHGTGRAFLNGTRNDQFDLLVNDPDNKTRSTGTALVGELGPEMVVNGNAWWTVGDNGAEFATIPSGSVIFDAWQTKQLLQNGSISTRGTAMLHGTAYNNATAGGSLKSADYYKSLANQSSASDSASAAKSSASAAKSAASAASDAKDAADENKQTYDWFETIISRIERDIDNIDKKVQSDFETFADRQQASAQEIAKVAEQIADQERGYRLYIDKANSVGLDETYAAKVRNGQFDIEDTTDEDLQKKIDDYKTWYEKALDVEDAIIDLKQKEQQLYQTRFETTQTSYENVTNNIKSYSDLMQSYVDLVEEQGYFSSKDYYEEMIKASNQNIDNLKSERDALIESMNDAVNNGSIKKGSSAWYDMAAAIDNVSNSIVEAQKDIASFVQAERQIDWDIFDYGIDRIDSFATEIDFIQNLMQENDKKALFDDQGYFTDIGAADFGAMAMKYDVYLQQARYDAKEIKKLDAEIANDPNNKNLLDRRRELLKSQQDYISNAKSQKQAMMDLVKDGIDKQVSSLNDLIQKYEDLIDADKDAVDYANEIQDAQEEINKLNKQMMSWQGDTSEQGMTNRQKVSNELKDKRQDLQDKQRDREIQEIKSTLSQLSDDFELALNSRLDNIDEEITAIINGVNENGGIIAQTFESTADEWGYELSSDMQETLAQVADTGGELNGSINSINGAVYSASGSITSAISSSTSALVSAFNQGFSNSQAAVFKTLQNIQTSVNNMRTAADTTAKTNITTSTTKRYTTSNTTKPATGNNNNNNTQKTPPQTTQPAATSKSDVDKYGVALAIINGTLGWGNDPYRSGKLTERGYNASEIQSIVNKIWKEGLVRSGRWQGHYYGLTFADLSRYRYKMGAKSINKDQLAWTNEGAPETIIRKSDGAILTPLAKGDSVLNNAAHENLWNMANSPKDFFKKYATPQVAQATNITNSSVNAQITFNLPNVKNYSEFMNAAKNDPKFEKLVQQMTLGRANGNNSLKKNGITFK